VPWLLRARVATRIERQGRTEQQIYDLLTPQQQARLPEILADMQARRAARMHASS
jgi:Spy/CpxP family protein refolding chaperone